MATPVVAGVAALIFAAHPDLIENNSESAPIAVEKSCLTVMMARLIIAIRNTLK